ncbi:MBL fold metallo-hydrolase [Mesorhizobium sp. M1409]|uniref:MBL fold metallo-hydrolase n=1 Tax=unclassified Mesorhizobium TaxID=325217 RepID=UPI003335BFC4
MKIGRSEVYRVQEYEGLGFPPKYHLPAWTAEAVAKHADWMIPRYYAPEHERLIGSVHSWIVRTSGITVLVDTCSGNGKERPHTPFFSMLETSYLEHFAATGIAPEDVDYVLCTHLHVDHVGWNTYEHLGRWIPTFPNAKYLVSRIEFEFLAEHEAELEDNARIFADSIKPLIETGQLLLLDPPFELAEGVFIEPAPGHTPGHVLLRVQESDGDLIFVGDILHHPIQVWYPDWNSHACRDGEQATQTRRSLLEHCSGTSTTLLPGHFAAPYCCQVGGKSGLGYECIFVADDE